MSLFAPKQLWLFLALSAAGLVVGSLILTVWLNLHPCHLCIFQRLLYMLLAALGLLAFFLKGGWRRFAGMLTLPVSIGGMFVAARQSWLQMQPSGSQSCVAGQPGMIERLVEWLGERAPELFLATGFCEDEELMILGLSLANWSLLCFAACLLLALTALRGDYRARPISH